MVKDREARLGQRIVGREWGMDRGIDGSDSRGNTGYTLFQITDGL